MAETVRGVPESEGNASSSKPWIIIVVVLVVLCCLMLVCGAAGWWLWENGDQLIDDYFSWSLLFSML
jgi:hypothetical protein